MKRDYSDIINLPHHEPDPVKHPRMSLEKRAAQFAPFKALTGQDDMIADTVAEAEEEAENVVEKERIFDY